MMAGSVNYDTKQFVENVLHRLAFGRKILSLISARVAAAKQLEAKPKQNSRREARLYLWKYWACLAGIGVFALVTLGIFMPARPAAALMHTMIFSVPLSALLYLKTRHLAWKALRLVPRKKRQRRVTLLALAAALFFATSGLVWAINHMGDADAGIHATFPILSRYEEIKHGHIKGFVTIELPASKGKIFSLGGRVDLPISEAEYAAAGAEAMQAYMLYHQGFLGLPWVEGRIGLVQGRTASNRTGSNGNKAIENKGVSRKQALP